MPLPRLLLLAVLAGLTKAAELNSYLHDGKTTYCWAVPQPFNRTHLTEADRVQAATECPLSMVMAVTSVKIRAFEPLNVSWAATTNGTLLDTSDSRDDDSSEPIVQANLQSCVAGAVCDPFDDGVGFVAQTRGALANLTDGQTTFRASLSFSEAGEYSVLAHIVVAGESASHRVDYGVFTRVTVLPALPKETERANSSDVGIASEPSKAPRRTASGSSILLSEGTIIGLLAGVGVALLLSLIAILRTRRLHRDRDSRAFHQCQPTPAANTLRVEAGHSSQATSTLPPTSPAGPRPRPRPRKQRSAAQLPSKTDDPPSAAAVPGASPVDDRFLPPAISQRGTAQWQDFVVPPRRSPAYAPLQPAESDLEL
ncbi:hypothetical protein P43SY_000647 [Pythium insidiosum]|uniref:Uncharacterized protein n=1 Tax=Pythium insidiosum TaxID=114742 RepID=A0AAD5LNM1_PYTIN|nr:hypothetical protein P43SY_000647 [Pythium insidiosum]